jgi:hypothetical protein
MMAQAKDYLLFGVVSQQSSATLANFIIAYAVFIREQRSKP